MPKKDPRDIVATAKAKRVRQRVMHMVARRVKHRIETNRMRTDDVNELWDKALRRDVADALKLVLHDEGV